MICNGDKQSKNGKKEQDNGDRIIRTSKTICKMICNGDKQSKNGKKEQDNGDRIIRTSNDICINIYVK